MINACRHNRGEPWLAALVFLVAMGCGEGGPSLTPVRGRLLYNGEPLPKAELVFHPLFEGPGWLPVAVTGEDGSFKAGTIEPGDGALAGRYKVTVVWRPGTTDDVEGPNLLPESYSRAETTDLEIESGSGLEARPVLRVTGPTKRKRP